MSNDPSDNFWSRAVIYTWVFILFGLPILGIITAICLIAKFS